MASRACDAAVNDWALLDDQHNAANEKITKAAFTNFIRHFWYLGIDLAGFLFFSKKQLMNEKRDNQDISRRRT